MLNYGAKYFEATKHLLWYLQGMCSRGITYGNKPNLYPIFKAFTNSDWAMSENCKSICGFMIKCGNGPLTWSSKQQVIIALLLCEAKYIACSYCAHQILWLCSLFIELRFPQNYPTPLYCNNQGTVACTHDPQSHLWMKHINIQAHFICDMVNNNLIDIHHIPGVENPADLFTKPFHWTTHHKWLIWLSMVSDHSDDNDNTTGHRSQGGVMTY